jgi:hypothetical protein
MINPKEFDYNQDSSDDEMIMEQEHAMNQMLYHMEKKDAVVNAQFV